MAAVVGSVDRQLARWSNWAAILPALNALASGLDRTPSLRPRVFSHSCGRQLSFGRLHFAEADHRRWTEALDDPDHYFDQVQIWSPSRAASIERGRVPSFYLQLVGDEELGEQGLVLSIARERLGGLAQAADRLLLEVAGILSPCRTLVADRPWAEGRILGVLKVNNLDDRGPWDAFAWAEQNPSMCVPAFHPPG